VREKSDSIKGEQQHAGVIEWVGQETSTSLPPLLYGGQGIFTTKKTSASKEIGDLLSTELLVKTSRVADPHALCRPQKLLHPPSLWQRARDDGGLRLVRSSGQTHVWLMQQFYAFTGNYGIPSSC